MPTNRAYVPHAGHLDAAKSLKCGLDWLLRCGEKQLHISFTNVDQMREDLERLAPLCAEMTKLVQVLLRKRSYTFDDGKILTVGTGKTGAKARPNGACLAVWPDKDSLDAIEARIGPVGSICAVPWATVDIDAWVQKHSPTQLNC